MTASKKSTFGATGKAALTRKLCWWVRIGAAHLIRAAPHNSASDSSERFCPKIKFGKRRNTLCTRKGYAASVGQLCWQRLRYTRRGYAASVSQLALATAALYFAFFKLQDWGKRSAAVRRRNCAVLPKVFLPTMAQIQKANSGKAYSYISDTPSQTDQNLIKLFSEALVKDITIPCDDLKSAGGNSVPVRVRLAAPFS